MRKRLENIPDMNKIFVPGSFIKMLHQELKGIENASRGLKALTYSAAGLSEIGRIAIYTSLITEAYMICKVLQNMP